MTDADGWIEHDGKGMPVAMLRDQFAMAAMAGGYARDALPEYELTALFGKHRTSIRREEILAADAYRLADAMLAQRDKKMTVKILRPGIDPAQKPMRGECRFCGCEFEFTPDDAKLNFDQRDGDYYSIPCPHCKRDYTEQVPK